MLNLSDKELDRLSKEAAQEYEPGDVLGPDAWERLKMRLDSDPGRVSPNPLRHIRRFPFYYAPLLLVLLGISYYYLTKHPPTSHLLVKNSSTTQNPNYSSKSTPSAKSAANPIDATGTHHPTDATNQSTSAADAPTAGAPVIASNSNPASPRDGAPTPKESRLSTAGKNFASLPANKSNMASSKEGASTPVGSRHSASGRLSASGRNRVSAAYGAAGSGRRSAGGSTAPDGARHPGNGRQSEAANERMINGNHRSGTEAAPTTTPENELARSTLQGRRPTKSPAVIDDSALRAFTLKSMPPGPTRRNVLIIKRNWQFGIVAAPDFASVNSLAGDKPGSTVGLTVDYQFAPRWYIGSGLLLDRRNYAARSQDFHPAHSFYSNNSIDSAHVDFVKGSFQMLEIPLNLRYDFSVTGSTLFFASAGVSSYILATENGHCYVNSWGQEIPKGFRYPSPSDYLFSAMNLSLGVETGLSNSMSLLIAPYMKIPLRTIGSGQVQMSSVGISFSLKWAPVTSRKRR